MTVFDLDFDADIDIYDSTRIAIIALAVGCIVMIIYINWGAWRARTISRGYATIRLGIIAVLVAIAYSTFEILVAWTTQARVFVLLAGLTWMTVGLAWSIHDEKE